MLLAAVFRLSLCACARLFVSHGLHNGSSRALGKTAWWLTDWVEGGFPGGRTRALQLPPL